MSYQNEAYWAHPNSMTIYVVEGFQVAWVTTVPINYWDSAYYVNINGTRYPDRFTSMYAAKQFVEATYALQR